MSNTNQQQLSLLKAQLEASLNPAQLEALNTAKPLHRTAKDARDRNNTAKLNLKAIKSAFDAAKLELKDSKEAAVAAVANLKAAQASVESTYTAEQAALKAQITENQKVIMAARLASKK